MEQTAIQLNSELLMALRQVMTIPKDVIALDLSMRMGEVPKLTCTTYVRAADGTHVIDGDKVQTVTKTYHLVENSDG